MREFTVCWAGHECSLADMMEIKLLRVSWDWMTPRIALVGIAQNTVPSHNVLHSYVSLENISHKWCVNGTSCGYFVTLDDNKQMLQCNSEKSKYSERDIAYLSRKVLIWLRHWKIICNLNINICLNKGEFQMKQVQIMIITVSKNHIIKH